MPIAAPFTIDAAMVAFAGFRTPLKPGIDTTLASPSQSHLTPAARGRASSWIIWTGLAIVLATSPALPQAGVALVKVDLLLNTAEHRPSNPIGSNLNKNRHE